MANSLQEIATGVWVQTSRLWHINSVVITATSEPDRPGPAGGATSDGSYKPARTRTVVVDPAWFPDEIAALHQAAAATPTGQATHVLFTHGDYDHVVGWQGFPEATAVIAHPGTAQRDAAETVRRVEQLDQANGTVRQPAFRYPPASRFVSPAWLDLGDVGTEAGYEQPQLPADLDNALLFFAAPGHEPDGLFTVLPDRGVLVAGDYLSDIEFPFIYYSLAAYRATLQLARQLCRQYAITQLVPGHGHVARSASEIERRITADLAYLDQLEAGVTQAKAQGLSVEQTVAHLQSPRRLRTFMYAGQPIDAPPWNSLASAHADNIRFVYANLPACPPSGH